MEEPVKGYFRLFPGNEVRLKTAYIVRCTGCKKDADGNVVEVYAEYDPADPRRQYAGRPEGQEYHSLGGRSDRYRCGSPSLRQSVLRAGPGCTRFPG